MTTLKDYQPLQLVNLLARETIMYYKLIGFEASLEECRECNNRIRQIQLELDSRRNSEDSNFKPLYNVE